MTFFPIYFLVWEDLNLWIPAYITFISFFVILNLYLHCGYHVNFLENILPKFYINSSAFHNVHHEKTNYNFGEMMSLWDYIMNTFDKKKN